MNNAEHLAHKGHTIKMNVILKEEGKAKCLKYFNALLKNDKANTIHCNFAVNKVSKYKAKRASIAYMEAL